jgi:hypothetical protein
MGKAVVVNTTHTGRNTTPLAELASGYQVKPPPQIDFHDFSNLTRLHEKISCHLTNSCLSNSLSNHHLSDSKVKAT